MNDYKGCARDLMALAKQNLEIRGKVMAIAILFGPEGKMLIPAVFQSSEEKEHYGAFFRAAAKKVNATEFFYIAESWMSEAHRKPDGSIPEFIRPSELPERREAIIVSFETKAPQHNGLLMQFFHKEGSKVVWGENREVFDHPMNGIFVNILETSSEAQFKG